MKTKDLIRKLQEEDPSGEEHVCVGNVDIGFISKEPAYYDGAAQVILYNEKGEIVGGKYKRSGNKIQVHLRRFSDLIWDRKEGFMVDYSELSSDRQEAYKENHQKIVKSSKDLDYEIELEYFVKHIKERAEKIMDDDEHEVADVAKAFYDANLNPYIPIPDDIPIIGESWLSRKSIQWGREIKVEYMDNELKISKILDHI
jgi:hypothetical protein